MNFSVTWSDSSRTQRASGANPRTPSRKRAMRLRIASSISRAIKSLTAVCRSVKRPGLRSFLHVAVSHPLSQNRGPTSTSFGSCPMLAGRRTSGCACGHREIFALRLGCHSRPPAHGRRSPTGFSARSTGWAGNARDADAERGLTAFADALRQAAATSRLTAPCLAIRLGGDVGELGFQFVGIHDRSAQKIARTAADGGDPVRQQATGAGFGDGQSRVPHLQVIADDLLERFALAGVESISKFVFNFSG